MKKLFTLIFFVPLVGLFAQNPVRLIEQDALWKYLDNGSEQGSNWTSIEFDDSGWKKGHAQLGYGDGDENTVVSYGGSKNNKYITTYFRRDFDVDDPAPLKHLLMEAIRDDGMAVYLNGQLVWADNMRAKFDYRTYASSTISGGAEDAWINKTIKGTLKKGKNVIAVEIHQRSRSSSDISFNFKMTAYDKLPVQVTRQPYIQMGSQAGATVRWRTASPVRSQLLYGTSLQSLDSMIQEEEAVTEHEMVVTGLKPDTRYYFEIATTDGAYIPRESGMFIHTSPETGKKTFVRAWILGDAGTGNVNQKKVRNEYYDYVASTPNHPEQTDMILFLGDNAYSSGTDQQYQSSLFDVYTKMLKRAPAWSTLGNHDGRSANSQAQSGPYYDIFTFPKKGEIGGVPSGTEAYYSFDYANIHFIVLESVTLFLDQTQLNWLKADIQSTKQDWVVALFHHPPYSKGSHNSDLEPNLVAMRSRFLPVLESNGVDLVLSGHSHSYERSYFLNGHYGFSNTFDKDKHTVGANGRLSGNPDTPDGAYEKSVKTPKGAVYITSGSAGKISNASLNHRAMYASLLELGSCIMEIENDGADAQNLTVKFINDAGQVSDLFTIHKTGISTVTRMAEEKGYEIMPNPVKSGLVVSIRTQTPLKSLTLYNVIGEIVAGSKTGQLSLKGVTPGQYTLRIETASATNYQALIVQ